MSLKAFLLSQLLGIIHDEEKRNTVIIIAVVILSLFLVIIFLPLFLILYPLETLKLFFTRR